MIISRSPLRVSLGGGGTDLPSYYMENGGFLIAGAINKYVYVLVNRPFNPGISLKYSSIEKIDIIDEISHPIIREVLKTLNLNSPQIEITSIADIPSGTGLGSSGSFTTGLIKALYAHYKRGIQAEELAELACDIEMNRLKVPTGKQDQYISSFGGITEFQIQNDGTVFSRLVPISISTLHDLEDNLLLFFTGISRSAGEILQDQNDKTILKNKSTINNLHKIKELGIASRNALVNGNTNDFGNIMNEHWEFKRKRSNSISNSNINHIYEAALKNGAVGGKLVGAGGGGFMMFYASDREKLRAEMSRLAMEEVRFQFDFEGTKVLFFLMLPIAILAGGLATRLGNLTTHTPKSLISINGKPFIYYQLQLLREAGFNEVVLCVGNLESKIIEYVGNGSKFNLKVVYSSDGEQRLGTGGAILNAIKLLGSDFFFIYGDSYLSLDFKSMENEYFENKDFALMSIYQNKNLFDKSNVAKTHGRSIKYVKNEAKENLDYIDLGCSIINTQQFLAYKASKTFDMSIYLESLSEKGELMGFESKIRFHEVGSKSGIKEFSNYIGGLK